MKDNFWIFWNSLLGRDELDMPVTKQVRNICRLFIYLLMSLNQLQDFLEAVQKCNKSVSKEDLNKYENWMEEFGSSWVVKLGLRIIIEADKFKFIDNFWRYVCNARNTCLASLWSY